MNDDADILYNILPLDIQELTAPKFAGGEVSFQTTGNDPGISLIVSAVGGSFADDTTRYGQNKPIDTQKFRYLSFRMFSEQASDVQIRWNKSNGGFFITQPIATIAGWNTYTIDVPAQPRSDGEVSATWGNGSNVGMRIDPARNKIGISIKFDWIQLTNTPCDFDPKPILTFVQPDREGGEDYFASVKGNPSNFDEPSDVAFMDGVSAAQILPGSSYQDSAGNSRTGDYLEAVNKAGNDDPVNYSVLDPKNRIDASRFKVACWTADILAPPSQYHSVGRIFWRLNGVAQTSEDLINRTTGEFRNCLRMDTLEIDGGLPQGTLQPWRNNTDGTGIDFFRIDLHEESTPTTYRVIDIRLAADHEADATFAIVVSGSRDSAIPVYYRTSSGSETLIGTYPTSRSSDVLVWNTSDVPAGTYSIVAKISGYSFIAPGKIVVDHTSGKPVDTTPPILSIDAPLASYRGNNLLEIAGFAVDNRRIATVEVLLDGGFLAGFSPTLFNLSARNKYPLLPYTGSSGFQRFLDLTAVSAGAHTVRVIAHDTAGNSTAHEASIVKGTGDSTPAIVYPVPNEAAVSVPIGVTIVQPTPVSTPGTNPTPRPGNEKLALTVIGSATAVTYEVTGAAACTSISILANNRGPAQSLVLKGATKVAMISSPGDFIEATSAPVPALVQKVSRGKTRLVAAPVYFLLSCAGEKSVAQARINTRSLRGSTKQVTRVTGVLRALKSGFKVS